MIDFRYHLVSVVAVLFALAAGIVLGTTVLSGPVLDGLNHSTKALTRSNADLAGQVDALDAARAGDAQFLASVAPLAAAGRLAGQSVAVICAPGVPAAERAGVVTLLQDAGAFIQTDIRLTPGWLDPARDPLLASLAGRLAGTKLPPGSGAAQAGDQLASLLVHRPGASSAAAGSGLSDSLSAYQEAGLLTVAGGGTSSATLAVLIAPATVTGGGAGPAAADLLQFAAALAGRAAAAVLVGPSGAATGSGVLAGASAVPGAPPVVTGDDTARGQLSVVLQLYRALGH
jgi:hypothetical protein